uniref:Putative secreted peptide n=1 Tax=Anopheles braziliensis TaxID=58242 RepID=A0A2M3ZNV0_9DIPT
MIFIYCVACVFCSHFLSIGLLHCTALSCFPSSCSVQSCDAIDSTSQYQALVLHLIRGFSFFFFGFCFCKLLISM